MKTKLLGMAAMFGAAAITWAAEPPRAVTFDAPGAAPIAAGVGVPAGRAYYFTSGTVPSAIKADGATLYERYGDTYTQGVSVLKHIAAVLEKQGLSLKDVVYLRAFVGPDPMKGGKPDFAGWVKAYGEFFNNQDNPVKTARATVGVAALVQPDWLLEVEAVAVYPEKK